MFIFINSNILRIHTKPTSSIFGLVTEEIFFYLEQEGDQSSETSLLYHSLNSLVTFGVKTNDSDSTCADTVVRNSSQDVSYRATILRCEEFFFPSASALSFFLRRIIKKSVQKQKRRQRCQWQLCDANSSRGAGERLGQHAGQAMGNVYFKDDDSHSPGGLIRRSSKDQWDPLNQLCWHQSLTCSNCPLRFHTNIFTPALLESVWIFHIYE